MPYPSAYGAAPVGLDPAIYSGHSLRAGFLTSAARRAHRCSSSPR